MSAAVEPQVALAVRRDLARVLRDADALHGALDDVASAGSLDAARAKAFELGLRFAGVAGLGELVSRRGEARDALLVACTDDDDTRAKVRALLASAQRATVFRALHGVFPASFRSPTLAAEQQHRARLKELPSFRVWPESPVTLADVYVAPACELWDGEERRFEDPLDAVRAWFADPSRREVVLMGERGAGKSVVCLMLAYALADDARYLPVFARGGVESLDATVAAALKIDATELDATLLPEVLLLVDGVRPPSNEATALRCVTVQTRLTSEVVGDGEPYGALWLQPFDDARALAWTARWNAHTGRSLDITPLLAPVDEEGPLAWRLTDSPFALLLLAQMQHAGRDLRVGSRLTDRASLYREIVSWACGRGSGITPHAHRLLLRRLAAQSRRDGERHTPGFAFAAIPLDDELAATLGGPALFPLVRLGERHLAFFHESLAEYLLAEHLAFGCNRLLATVDDVDSASMSASDDEAQVRAWIALFGRLRLDGSLRSLLRVMIPTWRNFATGGSRTTAGFAEAWRALVTTVLAGLLRDEVWSVVVDEAKALGVKPTTVRARALDAVLRLGGLRSATQHDPLPLDGLGSDAVETLFRTLRAARRELVDEPYERAFSLAELNLQFADLAGADLAGLDLSAVNAEEADLRGADLRRCVLRGAKLHRARLDGANLTGADLRDAVLIEASVRGAVLSEAQRAESVWSVDEGLARGIAKAWLEADEIPF